MQASQVPIKIPTIWANLAPAGTGVITVPIPSQIGITPDAASWTDGFPPATAQSGGYPRIQDANGGIQMISAWAKWLAAGGPIYYDATFSGAIGGYPSGCVLASVATLGNFWISTVDNNTSDPDTGGANWTSGSLLVPGKWLNFQSITTTGTYTPSTGTNTVVYIAVGAGGGSGGGGSTNSSQIAIGGSGNAGGITSGRCPVASVSGLTITIGAAGAAGAAGANAGGNGGNTSIGSVVTAIGGLGGGAGTAGATAIQTPTRGGIGIYTGTLLYAIAGDLAGVGQGVLASGFFFSGSGGSSPYGSGGGPRQGNQVGQAALGYGSGASGACVAASSSALAGAAGSPGIVLLYEYS